MSQSRSDHERFFRPRSVALVGVSTRTGPGTYNVLENLIADGCQAELHPINVRGGTILGRAVHTSVRDLPGPVDLAVITVPRERVPAVVQECVEVGIKALVIVTQGFSDADETGRQLEQELTRITAGTGTRFIGPNSIGLLNAFARFHTSFQRFDLEPRESALLCQSGMFLLGSADFTAGAGLAVDVGNAADLGYAALLPWLAGDPQVRVINVHIEGLENGAAFFDAAARITPHKPILAYKVGSSEAGARAVRSHSGALAGEDHVVDAGFRRAGILRVEDVEHWRDLNKVLLTYPELRGPRFAVLTLSGGGGIVAVDALGRHGLEVAELSRETRARLGAMNPGWLEVTNPIDTWMAALRRGLAGATVEMLQLLLQDDQVDGVIILLNSYRVTGLEVLGELIRGAAEQAAARRDKPVVFWAFGANQQRVIEEVERSGVAVGFTSPDRLARALSGLHRYHDAIKGRAVPRPPALEGCRRVACAELLHEGDLLGAEALELLDGYGVPTAPARLAGDLDEARRLAAEIGYPVTLKVASPDLSHKSDVGGVALGIRDPDALAARHRALLAEVGRRAPSATIEGVWVQRFHEEGVEVIVGARRHPGYGAVVVFGLGGIYTEVLRDVSFRLAPCTEADAKEMIDEIQGRAILEGARGGAPVHRAAIEQVILRVSRLVSDFHAIDEVDINPLIVSPRGALAVDARVIVADPRWLIGGHEPGNTISEAINSVSVGE